MKTGLRFSAKARTSSVWSSLVASLIWAFGALIQRGLNGVPVLTITAWVGAMGSLAMVPATLIGDPAGFAAIPDLPLSAFGWVAYAAVVSTILGHGAMAWLLQRHDVSVIVPFTIPTPVVSVAAVRQGSESFRPDSSRASARNKGSRA